MVEADDTKRARGEAGPTPGGIDLKYPGARPLRRKGWYRAARREVPWAVEWTKKSPFAQLFDFVYFNGMLEALATPCYLLNLFAKEESWKGGTLVVPFKL